VARRPSDGRITAVTAALAPYAWRGLTDRMLARRVVGALDRHAVLGFLTGLPGTDVGAADPVEPAGSGDERVDVLVRALQDRHWRGLVLDQLSADLVAVLDSWGTRRAQFDRDLQRLLGEH
jgi:hypothetical protein